jgi:starch synthase
MGVLMVASEITPWVKTGGLADVLGAMPEALADLGHDVTVVVPRHRGIDVPRATTMSRGVRLGALAEDITYHTVTFASNRRVVFVDCPKYFDRDGVYGFGGRDYSDNADRFALLSVAALDYGEGRAGGLPIEIVHAHDWQAGLVPLLLRSLGSRWPRLSAAGRIFTIHNMAYQGLFPRDVVPRLGLPWDVFGIDRGEFWGRFSFLKAGIADSDYITTVSPKYRSETITPAAGAGMEGVLAARASRYVGILNGIDTRVWNPQTDPHLPAHYGPADLSGKAVCKRALLARFNLPVGDDALARPAIGMVSRLVAQKGLDLIDAAAEELVALDASWTFVGTGDRKYEALLQSLAARYPSRVAVHIGFDEGLAHLMEAGSDMFLMPSLFEPCGLNQMYSLRYGTVPIVTAVGGLDDTVQPFTPRARHANGFKFDELTPDALARTVKQAVRLFRQPDVWARLMAAGMAEDHSWSHAAREYVKVYRRARLVAAHRGAA